MAFDICSAAELDSNVGAIGLCYYADLSPAFSGGPEIDVERLKTLGFEGKAGQVQTFSPDGLTVIAVGLGDSAEVTSDTYRRAAAHFAKAAAKYETVALMLSADAQSIGEGLVLGSYKFNKYKSKPDDRKLTEVQVVGADTNGLAVGETIAKAVGMARDMINEPAADMTPTRIAELATQAGDQNGLRVEVWNGERVVAERLGGLAGVAAGSDQPPCLIKMFYEPDGATKTIALVGKGITFDSGGLSIKSGEGMMTMKTDMSGAAAVVAAMSVLPTVAPNVRVIGIAAATENMPGPSATKPGDVLKARNGKTMEVLNTDAEGRLVLADALSLAVEEDVDAIIDLATLTGACKMALGNDIAGLFTNNEAFGAQVRAAALSAGEPVWPLPLHKGYRKNIDSDIADMKNIGSGGAGATTAALFLEEFVDDKPWVHLDIAGPAVLTVKTLISTRAAPDSACAPSLNSYEPSSRRHQKALARSLSLLLHPEVVALLHRTRKL